jgi:ribosomal protein S18 acetylase RimI-like enzyme
VAIEEEDDPERETDPRVVRRAVPEDARAVAVVHVRSWQAAYRGLVPDEVLDSLSVDRRATLWVDAIADPNPRCGVWVAERGGVLVGFVHVRPTKDVDAAPSTGEVGAIYLAPEAWSLGLGRALLDSAVVDLRRTGFQAATLWVFRDNERARRFYERAGWASDGALKSIEIGGLLLAEVRYRIDLASLVG